MAQYYFLISALPPIQVGKQEISFKEFKDLLFLNLTPNDFQKFQQLLRPIDLYNIRALWMGLPIDERGNWNETGLADALIVQDHLPMYIIDYLNRYESNEDRIRYFSSLFATLYRDKGLMEGFLGKYFAAEREIRLVLTALRAKRAGRDVARELQFEDPTDPLVADILAQKDANDFIPPQEYEDLKTIFSDNSSDANRLDRALLEYRLKKIEELDELQDFSIDRVLSYAARLLLVDSISRLDREKGLEHLSKYE